MGLDLAFGQGKKAAGGILLRSLMPVRVISNDNDKFIARNSDMRSEFIEGPCNCVKKILELT